MEIKGGKWEEKESANATEGSLYFIQNRIQILRTNGS